MSLWDDLRYDYPRLYRGMASLAALGVSSALLLSVPDNDVTRAMGLTALAQRSRAACAALYWEGRALISMAPAAAPSVVYGTVAGVDAEGAVLISVPEQSVFVLRKVVLANIRITDVKGERNLVLGKSKADARIESYGEVAVIWINGVALNLALIDASVAVPESEPPTTIVARVFATHLWNQAKGVAQR